MLSEKTEELQGMQEITFDRQELKSCAMKYAIIAAIGSICDGIPVVGGLIAGIIQFLAIWLMYCHIATIAGIKKGFKFIVAGIIANSLSVILMILPISCLAELINKIPVAGNILGALLGMICAFFTLQIAARIFKVVFTNIFKGKRSSQE